MGVVWGKSEVGGSNLGGSELGGREVEESKVGVSWE